MYLNVDNSAYGSATATYADYAAVSNIDTIRYSAFTASVYHTSSVDYYRYNKGGDEHEFIGTLTRPLNASLSLMARETGSNLTIRDPLHTELNNTGSSANSDFSLENGLSFDLENSFGRSIDLYETNLAIGCPYYTQVLQFGTVIEQLSGSAVYIFNLGVVNATSSYDQLTAVITYTASLNQSFGTAVSINKNWVAIGCPTFNNNSGSVFIYQYQTGSGQWSLFQQITSSNSTVNELFGYTLKLNKESSSLDKIIIGSGNQSNDAAYYFELSGSIWIQTYKFTPNYKSYPLTIGDYTPYNLTRNISSGFGMSVSTYGNTCIIGEYLDRTVFEYSGSEQYQQGSVSIFEKCNENDKAFELVFKTYGNENIIKSNNLGFSVDVFGDYAAAGIPKSNQHSLSSCYIQNTVNQYHQCDDNVLNSLIGQVAFLTKESGSWGIKNIFQKKKKYLSPYRAFGNSVAISDFSMVVGSPILFADNGRAINIFTTQSQDIALDDISGKAYVYNIHNFKDNFHIGNVFYRNGKIVMMTSGSIFQDLFIDSANVNSYSYNLEINGQNTIYEKQVLCNINTGEFNVSTNPSSLEKNFATFDLNQNSTFDYQDLEILMRYMKYKNNQSLGLSFSTDWSSSVVLNDDEISLLKYYKTTPLYNETYITQQVLKYIPIWDFQDISVQTNLDFNGDNVIDIRDMNILWKYFSNRLDQKNYALYITPNSSRQIFSQVTDFLNQLCGKYITPTIADEFFNYRQKAEMDKTGSYLAPMITTVGLYTHNLELVAVAKLGTPIKNGGDLPLNILIKMDF